MQLIYNIFIFVGILIGFRYLLFYFYFEIFYKKALKYFKRNPYWLLKVRYVSLIINPRFWYLWTIEQVYVSLKINKNLHYDDWNKN